MIIAIDGPAASGKGTLGKRLAEHYGFAHLDTGLLYRAVARVLQDQGCPARRPGRRGSTWRRNLDVSHLDDDSRLRGADMGEAASVVSAYQPVRDALLAFQRQFANQAGGRPRRAGHRHRGVPGRGCEALHHRQPRGARPAAVTGSS